VLTALLIAAALLIALAGLLVRLLALLVRKHKHSDKDDNPNSTPLR
jgi:hypothetical protein